MGRGGTLGRRLDHECGALINGASALIKKTPELPRVIVGRGGTLGRRLDHECGALINGASALIKKTPESSLPLYPVRTMAQGCLTCPPAHIELLLWLEVRREMVPRYAGGCLPVLLPQNALESGL